MIVQALVIYYGTASMFRINLDVTFAAIFIVSINTGLICEITFVVGLSLSTKDNLKPAKLSG